MPFVAAPGVARVSISYLSAFGENAANVYHVQNSGAAPWDTGELGACVDVFQGWLTSDWATVANANWQSDLIRAVALDTNPGIVIDRVATVSGDETSEALPAQNTIALSWRTGFTGRSKRGRTFHVGLSEASVEGSFILTTPALATLAAYENLITLLQAAGYDLGVLSYVTAGAPRVTPLFTAYNSVIFADTIVDSMDSRKP